MKLRVIFTSITVIFSFILLCSLTNMTSWEVPAKFKNMKNPYAGKEDVDKMGAELWKKHCRSCHGSTGNGDGNKAEELDTEMRDMAESDVQGQTDGELYYKSFYGKGEMPNFTKKITDEEEQWMLVNYMRTFKE